MKHIIVNPVTSSRQDERLKVGTLVIYSINSAVALVYEMLRCVATAVLNQY